MVWVTNDEADALVSECYELFGHRGADLPIVGVDAAVFIGVLRGGDANERDALRLQHGRDGMLSRAGGRQNHSIGARTADVPGQGVGDWGGPVIDWEHVHRM